MHGTCKSPVSYTHLLPGMPVCAVTSVGPDGVSRSVERLAALAAVVMRKESICVTAPEQPKSDVYKRQPPVCRQIYDQWHRGGRESLLFPSPGRWQGSLLRGSR